MNVGGKSIAKKPKVKSPGSEARAIANDPDAIDPLGIDPKALDFIELQMSSVLRAQVRARATLRQLTIRLSTAQLDATRQLAKRSGEPYQRLLRQWISEGLLRDLKRKKAS
jgi:predicted DNA binding CopG/RHH family protein